MTISRKEPGKMVEVGYWRKNYPVDDWLKDYVYGEPRVKAECFFDAEYGEEYPADYFRIPKEKILELKEVCEKAKTGVMYEEWAYDNNDWFQKQMDYALEVINKIIESDPELTGEYFYDWC